MINLGLNEDIIEIEHIPDITGASEESEDLVKSGAQYSLDSNSLKDIVNRTEKQVIQKALKETGGNRKEAAEILGIAVRSLYYKINKYEID